MSGSENIQPIDLVCTDLDHDAAEPAAQKGANP